ncbi:MAG: lipopolysaccharide biosynthesis protein [Muribaculaceae bacterium]|nr:lipopolysaccharide biosynthesis protein [Muribaculaceae bacterium]
MLWTGIDRLGTQLIQFVIGILIARVLLPSDYGLIGMLAIFMGVAQTFLDSGFANALIQKKDRNTLDYSTVFYFSIVIGVILYLILYVAAPWIADFYSQPILTQITRVYMLTLVINGLAIVHTAKMTIDLDFRSQAVISIVSIICSGGLGIWMAYSGYGVWALVWQGICLASVRMILSWIFCRWLPLLRFSLQSFRKLFSFGSKLLGSSLINRVSSNLSTIIIGKVFHSAELGFFTRANQFCVLPTTTITNIVLKVNFPILSQLQDDDARLLEAYKTLLRTPVWLLYPILFGIAALARPLILTLLGENWLGSASLIPILAFGSLWDPLTHINLNLLYVKGRSDLVLKLELIKKPIAFVMLLSAIPFGIIGMCISIALYSFIAFCFNCHYTGKMLGYGFGKQVREILPILGYCVVMLAGVVPFNFLNIHPAAQLFLGIAAGMIIYISVSVANKDTSYLGVRKIIKEKFHI